MILLNTHLLIRKTILFIYLFRYLDSLINSLDLTSHFYLFFYLLCIVVFTQNIYGTEWPFMC